MCARTLSPATSIPGTHSEEARALTTRKILPAFTKLSLNALLDCEMWSLEDGLYLASPTRGLQQTQGRRSCLRLSLIPLILARNILFGGNGECISPSFPISAGGWERAEISRPRKQVRHAASCTGRGPAWSPRWPWAAPDRSVPTLWTEQPPHRRLESQGDQGNTTLD